MFIGTTDPDLASPVNRAKFAGLCDRFLSKSVDRPLMGTSWQLQQERAVGLIMRGVE